MAQRTTGVRSMPERTTPAHRGLLAPAVAAALVGLLAAGCGGTADAPADGAAATGDATPEAASDAFPLGEVTGATAPDGHKLREIPADSAPTVELTAEPDPVDGWNLHIAAEGYEFVPEQAGKEAAGGEGHAHLYIDGEKYARVYGQWFHLPAEAIGGGEHTVMVTLNANDHTTWAVDGEAIQAETDVSGSEAAQGHGDHGDHEEHGG
ncbi:hypothetical protein GCM10009799_43340 [Nocardiopsis rhodophaea]|uniref:Uncharacterized protein n=1 Tax=Nocardiopsis rhodophaea TaxID=280238 RepID=A0ABN2TI82_9ACTN